MVQIVKFAEIPEYNFARTRVGSADAGEAPKAKKGVIKCLFKGTNGEPGNFMLVATAGELSTGYHPRHVHCFDQFRYAYKGNVNMLSKGKVIPEGCVAYYPAGTYYGPYDGEHGGELISVQFEGAHRSDYIDIGSPEMNEAVAALSKSGSIKNGVYTWIDENGGKHNKESMTALMEYIRGGPEAYPAPRFDEPIVMNPNNFKWVPAGEGGFSKELATFCERKTTVGMIRVSPKGSYRMLFSSRITLIVVVDGSVTVGNEQLGPKDAIRLDAGEEQVISSSDGGDLLYMGLPFPADQ
jgi:hypothetical protein